MAEQESDLDVNDLIIENDTGARNPRGFAGKLLIWVAISWSLFQLWIASPLQFELGVFILNDTQSRSIHLAFATFLAFTAYPTFKKSPRTYIPILDWVMALVAAFCSAYLYMFYEELALRPGLPTDLDIGVSIAGIILLLEAARRSLGLPLMIMGAVFLGYTFFGSASWMPDLIAHKGQSLNKVANHMWLSTEGVFGIALGVSSGFVFLFVLFGALLDKAGAGNYFIKVAFSLLGHLRGGPAKAAVLSSGLTGFISGSSIANVVTTGTFTVPLMRKVGFTAEKAGAVEVSGSVNGQIMPPVMGAAAFIMVEYVQLPYNEIIKHAFLPAVISYIALIYMVHLEALKNGVEALKKPVTRTVSQRLIGTGITVTSIIILVAILYYAIGFIKSITGDYTIYAIAAFVLISYISLIKYEAKYPDLEPDDPDAPIYTLPETGPTVKTGLHYILPVVVLVWSLMVERLSPGLSAFWACMVMMFILLTQHAIFSFFRKNNTVRAAFKAGWNDLTSGLIAGARNMIGIGVATAAAGIIVGTVSLTGIGNVMTDLVEVLSGGSLLLILIFTAIISLILGMGLPTTANYIVVASIMAGVVMELGKQHGLIVPAIAVHMFVFYFGIMADVTPPVGLASFAAAAISKGDPIKTGFQAFIYSTRTAILPFFFIFNNELLLLNIDSIFHGVFVFTYAAIGLLLFSAGTQGYFLTKSKLYESAILMIVAVMIFIPGRFLNLVYPEYDKQSGATFETALESAEVGDEVRLYVLGETDLGDPRHYYTDITVPEKAEGKTILQTLGFEVSSAKGKTVIENKAFGSPAANMELDFYEEIETVLLPAEQPSKYSVFFVAFLLLMVVYFSQRSRRTKIYDMEV